MRMRRIVIRGLSRYAVFSTLSQKRDGFRKNATEHKMCFDFQCNFLLKRFSF